MDLPTYLAFLAIKNNWRKVSGSGKIFL